MIRISPEENMRQQLRSLAGEIVSEITAADPSRSEELLSTFVSELVLSIAEQSRQAEQRRRQAEGIAAAKARGVRFGRPARTLPDNFDALRKAWRNRQMTLSQAASACGLPEGTFYSAALRREQAEGENPA